MRVLKWVFHPVNLLIVIVLVALYINRQTLFPELSNSPEVQQLVGRVDSVIDAIDEGVTAISADVVERVAPEETPDNATAEGRAETSVTAADSSVETPQPRFDDLPTMEATPAEAILLEEAAEEQQPDPAEMADSEENTDRSAAVVTEAPSESSGAEESAGEPMALWREARRAAWAEQPERAVEQYRALIALQPDNYDAYGEMGNVLLRMGEREAAVDAYSRAAMLITRSDYPQVAWRVLEIVARLDREKGNELYEAIRRQQISSARPRARVENQ